VAHSAQEAGLGFICLGQILVGEFELFIRRLQFLGALVDGMLERLVQPEDLGVRYLSLSDVARRPCR
jgi:hypothetical protein